MRTPLTQERIDDIASLLADGHTVTAIMKQIKCSHRTVNQVFFGEARPSKVGKRIRKSRAKVQV
jgi:hypothetical protein